MRVLRKGHISTCGVKFNVDSSSICAVSYFGSWPHFGSF